MMVSVDDDQRVRPMPLDVALDLVRPQLAPVLEQEHVGLLAARGRILAEDLIAPVDLPLRDCSAMDGFALRTRDLSADGHATLKLIGEAVAGHPFGGTIGIGQIVRILTGAPLPEGADRVVEQEACSLDRGRVRVHANMGGKDHRRRRGEDVTAGSQILLAGHRLRSQDVALAGALGLQQLTVRRCLRVGLFSTGDELCEPGSSLGSGQIWDANRLLLPGLLEHQACEVRDYGILRDEPSEIETRLLSAARDCDLLVTTGGMSVGREDHIRSIIGRRGALEVWPLAIKPGRPVGLGDIDDCPILALPGNPLAATIAFIAFGRPVVCTLSGARDEAPASLRLPAGFAFEKNVGLRQYLLAGLVTERFGMSTVIPWHKQSAAMLSPLTEVAGLIMLPEHRERVRFGELVDFLPIDAFLR